MRDDTLCPAQDLSIHFLNDTAVVFDRPRQALFSANRNAATILQGLEQMPPGEIAAALADSFKVDHATARRHIADTLRQWRRWRREIDRADAGPEGTSTAEGRPLPAPPAQPVSVTRYRLLDSTITVRFADGVEHRDIEPVLGHLRADDRDDGDECVLDVVRLGDRFAVAEHGRLRQYCETRREIAAMLKACIAETALTDCKDAFAAVHAGAVRRDGTCILLPGASGAGKSCLVAGLAAEGFTVLGDDTLALTRTSHAVRPLPFGICIKEPAPKEVVVRFPVLDELPLHARPDGKRVRYLTPPEIAVTTTAEPTKIDRIVFPEYRRSGGTELVPISDGVALQRLLASVTLLADTLQASDVDALIDWISATPCYLLRMASLSEAAHLLAKFDG